MQTASRISKTALPAELRVQGVKITHADRVIDVRSGLTKQDLARYYAGVAPLMLPFLRGRPVYLLRAPHGVDGERFFQRHPGRIPIPGMRALRPAGDPGHGELMAIDAVQGLVGAAQMGAIELHVAGARADLFDRPDSLVLDLDPDPALPWSAVVKGALSAKAMLDALDLQSFVKTSGGKGLHIVVPLARRHEWKEVADFSEALAHRLTQTMPALFSAKMGEQNRVCKIYVDYLRNQKEASTAAPYSARARAGLPVSAPLTWEELPATTGAAMWTIANLSARLSSQRHDPWQGYFAVKQMLNLRMKKAIGAGKK